jgi:uncharacterized phage protein gp47/JayE
MPWSTPTLREVRSLVRDAVHASLPGSDANVPNSVLRVLSDSQGALCHLTLQYVDWLALQLLPDTAETEWLDRHGDIWLVNADGTTGRKMATLAYGQVALTGTVGVVVPVSTQLETQGGVGFETTETVTLEANASVAVMVRALDPGTAGNLTEGTRLGVIDAVSGLDQTAVVIDGFIGGTDEETDEELRARVLRRIRQPPMGGAEYDYEAWALAVPGVTRAWAASEMGIGTVTVRFLMDDLRADDDGWPTPNDVAMVAAYIDTKRPVTTKDCFVEAPIKQFLDITIANLVPNTTEARAEIEKSVRDMLFVKAAPGQTIFAAWVNYAIMSAPHVQSFDLITTADYVMASLGHMAVLETILYEP